MPIAKHSVDGCEQKLHTIPSITFTEIPENSAMALIQNVCEVLRSVNPGIKLCQGANDSMIADIFPIKLFSSITRQRSPLNGLVVHVFAAQRLTQTYLGLIAITF